MSLIVATPSDTEIVLTREFRAPRERVFAAITRPDLLPRWYGARGWNLVVCEIDLRVGGTYRFVSRGPGGAEIGSRGEYREIDPPGLLIYTEAYDDNWSGSDILVRTELTEVTKGRPPAGLDDADDADDAPVITTMTNTLTFPNREVRDGVLDSPMKRGVGEGYDRLDALLEAR